MNFKKTMIAIAAQMLLVGGAYAQTCSPAAGAITQAQVGTPFTIDTCASTNQLAVACNNLSPIGNSTDTIYSVQIGATATGSIAVTPNGYDAYLALIQGTCAGGSTCSREQDDNPSGGVETAALTGLAAGTYYVLITSFTAPGGPTPSCGSTQILVSPTLPVTLQNFSVN